MKKFLILMITSISIPGVFAQNAQEGNDLLSLEKNLRQTQTSLLDLADALMAKPDTKDTVFQDLSNLTNMAQQSILCVGFVRDHGNTVILNKAADKKHFKFSCSKLATICDGSMRQLDGLIPQIENKQMSVLAKQLKDQLLVGKKISLALAK